MRDACCGWTDDGDAICDDRSDVDVDAGDHQSDCAARTRPGNA